LEFFLKKLKQKYKAGFTLIELLVVIATIGVLAAIAMVSMNTSRERARYARTVADLNQIAKAAALYYGSFGNYPADTWTDVMPAGFNAYINRWPRGAYNGSYFDWDNWNDPLTWSTPAPAGTRIVQVSLRFCTDVDSEDCQFPNQSWATGFTNRSSVYYCLEGPCRSHKNLPINAPGKCVNC
jgi:prepilin-type N-terminal cleavage/methylation domain-containing protein